MKKQLPIHLIAVLVLFVAFSGCSKETTTTNNNTTPLTEREQAAKDYNDLYLGSFCSTSQLAWTGVDSTCVQGTISQMAYDKVLTRINYFRKICGLTNITWNSAWHDDCQKAALIMTSNNTLSTKPGPTWKCYTLGGYNAAGVSNLALGTAGYHTSQAVTSWIQNEEVGMYSVPYRRWILFSRAKDFGFGSTNRASILWCQEHTGDPLPSGCPDYIAYPPKYIPQNLVFKRWSLGVTNVTSYYTGVDFSTAQVIMTDPSGGSVPVNIVSTADNGAGDQTIVWVPQNINTTSSTDVTYHVKVKDVKLNGIPMTFDYDVTIFKP